MKEKLQIGLNDLNLEEDCPDCVDGKCQCEEAPVDPLALTKPRGGWPVRLPGHPTNTNDVFKK
jgi:hypothetical protein